MELVKLGSVCKQPPNYSATLRTASISSIFLRIQNADLVDASIAETLEVTTVGDQPLLRRFRTVGDLWSAANALQLLASAGDDLGDPEWTQRLIQESQVLYRELGDRAGMAGALDGLASVLRWQGDYQQAAQHYDDAISLFRELGLKPHLATALHGRGMVAYHQGDDRHATALFKESLALFHETQQSYAIGWCFQGLAGVAGRERAGQAGARQAARLLAACRLLEQPDLWSPGPRAEWDGIVDQARAQLSDGELAAAWAEGLAMSLEEAIAYALEQN